MKLLFVCSRNRRRSPTAEIAFLGLPDIEVMSAGTPVDAENPVSAELIEWADIVFVRNGDGAQPPTERAIRQAASYKANCDSRNSGKVQVYGPRAHRNSQGKGCQIRDSLSYGELSSSLPLS